MTYKTELAGRVYEELHSVDLTADEVAARLGKSVLAVRPRVSELCAAGRIVRTGEHRKNESGLAARVYRRVS